MGTSPKDCALLGGKENTLKLKTTAKLTSNKPRSPWSETYTECMPPSWPPLDLVTYYLSKKRKFRGQLTHSLVKASLSAAVAAAAVMACPDRYWRSRQSSRGPSRDSPGQKRPRTSRNCGGRGRRRGSESSAPGRRSRPPKTRVPAAELHSAERGS
jgi:hypothetical protein